MDRNNKNKYDNEDALKKEQQLISEIQSILHKKYGYSPDQMRYQIPPGSDSQRIADLVVFDKDKSPIIIVEVTKSSSILPLSEYQLRELLFDSNANFGLVYNGRETRVYQKIGNSLVQIKEIPKLFEIKSTKEATEKFGPLILPEKEIWRIAEIVRRDFYDYIPLFQVLALKILDEEEYKRNLFEPYYTRTFDEKGITRLIEVGRRHFPILFTSGHSTDNKTRLIQLLDTVKNFSFQRSNVETITKAILRFSMHRYRDWFVFPDDLSSFMLQLLSITKNKKILIPYAGLGYYFRILNDLRKNFKLTKQAFSLYIKNFFAVTEINMEQTEILRII